MIVSQQFRLLNQEGHLASRAFLAGFQEMASIDYDRPGTVYSTLFQLSIALERLMKIVIILDHMAQHNFSTPTDKDLRRLGHSLIELYMATEKIGRRVGVLQGWFQTPAIQTEILSTLSEFARGARYFNIDQLVNGANNIDPLTRWFGVHMKLAKASLSYERKESIMARSRAHCEAFGLFGWEMGPKGQYDLTVDVTYELEVARVTRGHVVWSVIEILKPMYLVMGTLEDALHRAELAKGITPPVVPHMTEFFPFGMTDRSTAIRRKQWTSLFHIGGRV